MSDDQGFESIRREMNQARLEYRVLVVDEPTIGLDPEERIRFRQLMADLGQERTIVLSTHILEEVEAVCTRVIIINRGSLVFDGTPEAFDAVAPAKTF